MGSRSRGSPLALALAVLFAALSLGAALLSGSDSAPLAACAGPILLFGAGYPLLMRWTPVEPSALKLGLFGSLLSPLVVGVLLAGFELALAPEWAWRCTFGACALLQLLVRGRTLRLQPLGRVAWGTLALAALLGALLFHLLLGAGNAPRLTHEGALFQAGLAQSLEHGHPWENPWLAGTVFPAPVTYPFLGRLFAHAFAVATPSALASVAVWSAVLTFLAVYLIGAVLWREPRRVALTAPLAVLGAGAFGGLLGLGSWAAPPADEAWAVALARGMPGSGPGDLLYGLAGFFRPAPLAPALAYATAGWLAAAHGWRHGRRPWVGLTGLLLGVALVLEPAVGFAAVATALLALLLGPPRPGIRGPALLALAFWALPGLASARVHGLGAFPEPPTDGASPLNLLHALGPSLLLAVGLLSGRWRAAGEGPEDSTDRGPGPDDERGRTTVLVLVILGVIVPPVVGWVWPVLAPARPGLVLLASLAAGTLAAGGVLDLLTGPRRARLAGAALVLTLAAGATRACWGAYRAHAGFAARDEPAKEEAGRLLPTFPSERELEGDGLLPRTVVASEAQRRAASEIRRRHRALAYGWIRESLPSPRARGAILVRAVDDPDPAPLYTDLPLAVDGWPALAFGHPLWEPRHQQVSTLFASPQGVSNPLPDLRSLDRPLVFLVEERDRERTHPRGEWRPFRGIDLRLERLGAERVFVAGTAAVYLWLPPREDPRQ